MARTPSDTSVRARVLGILDAADGEPVTVEQVGERGKWTATERKNLAVNIDKMFKDKLLCRAKIKNPSKTPRSRAEVFGYAIEFGHKPAQESHPATPARPLRADHAADALANPPRGRSAIVPSLASAPNPNARKVAPLLICGDAVALSHVDDAKRDAPAAPDAPWFVVAVSPRFDTLEQARKYAQDIAETETDVEVVVATPIESLRLVPQWERV